MCGRNVRFLPATAKPRRGLRLAAIALVMLFLHAPSPSPIQAAPATQIQWLGSYDITNLDPTKAANDFHALLSDMRVKFKFGRTNTVPLSQPPTTFFNLKVLDPAQNNTNTTNGVVTPLRTRLAQVGVVVNRFGNLVKLTLENQDNTALVLSNLQAMGRIPP